MSLFNLTIVTPEGQAYKKLVKFVTAPGEFGYFGVLANHAGLISLLKAGTVTIVEENGKVFFAIRGGVLEVDRKHDVLILADQAVLTVDETEAKEKLNELLTTTV